MKKTLNVEGMSCGHCAMKVQEALESIDGVGGAKVNHKKGVAKITSDREIPFEVLKAAVDETGYTLLDEAGRR